MIKTTRAQRVALFRVFQRDFPSYVSPCMRRRSDTGEVVQVSSIQWRRFRSRVRPLFDKSGCVMLPWAGMWLGIETDGYTHS
jgi:hypothetical protein